MGSWGLTLATSARPYNRNKRGTRRKGERGGERREVKEISSYLG